MNGIGRKHSFELTDILDNNSQYPDLSVMDDKTVWVSWQQYQNRHDTIWAGRIADDKLADVMMISGEGEALRPVNCIFKGAVWYAWSECLNGEWSILARYWKEGRYSRIITVSKGDALFYPCLYVDHEKLGLLFNEQGKGVSASVMYYLDFDSVSEKMIVSQTEKSYRPTGCIGGDGNLYVAYDSFQGDTYHVLVRVCQDGIWSGELKVNTNDKWATRPIITRSGSGAVLCWYEYGERASFSYCAADVWMEDGDLKSGVPEALSSNTGWYHDISVSSNHQGTVVFAYTWGKYNINVRYRMDGGQWSEPAVLSYNDTHCAVHPAVAVDDENEIHLLWQYAHKNGHLDRNACIVYNRASLEEMDENQDDVVEKAVDQFVQPIPGNKGFGCIDEAKVEQWLKKNGYEGLKLVFGDIHGQSGISDGVGEIDQYYHYAKAKANLDFTALTDHDCYPDWISQSEWEWMRTTNRLMNTEDELACLLAYEWTPNEYRYDYGHKNVYYRGDEGEIFRSGDVSGMTPFQLFESLKQYSAMAFPHHPAANWGLVSAATDWNFHDPQIQRLVEIFSRHANFEDFESVSRYTKNIAKLEGCSVADALARKYRIGFSAGSDSHQMEHGIEGGIMAAFVPELTRESVYDAMYDRFTYGTTGARILVSLKVGTAHMGQEIVCAKECPVLLDVSAIGIGGIRVELIKNNQSIASWECEMGVCDVSYRDDKRSTDDCYYVKVTQKDEHMAWTSPIWVTTG